MDERMRTKRPVLLGRATQYSILIYKGRKVFYAYVKRCLMFYQVKNRTANNIVSITIG